MKNSLGYYNLMTLKDKTIKNIHKKIFYLCDVIILRNIYLILITSLCDNILKFK